MTDVFVYGTLTDRARVDAVLDEYEFRTPAVLEGLRRVDGKYPTLAPGGNTRGRVLRTPEIDALDAYEGVSAGLYVRVPISYRPDERSSVPRDRATSGGDAAVAAYVGDPERLNADASWPGPGSFEDRVRRYVRDRGAVVRSAPADR